MEEEKKKVIAEIERASKMLSNPGFVNKAPEAKINEEKAKLEKYQNKSEYELAVLKREAAQDGKVLIKKSTSTKTAIRTSSSAETRNATKTSWTRTIRFDANNFSMAQPF